MKLYHAALWFVIIAGGFFFSARCILVTSMGEAGKRKTEYDCLVAAVNAATEVAFSGTDATVTQEELDRTAEVFFQTLGVLQEGTTDRATWEVWRAKIPCLIVFDANGYYRYCFVPQRGYEWSEQIPYENGRIPERFFSDTEMLLQQYHTIQGKKAGRYRVLPAEEGIWERSITPPCVLAVSVPKSYTAVENKSEFLYAASGRVREVYYVTEDNYCHLPYCEYCTPDTVVAYYTSQKESAEDGAMPCECCMK